jgi:hypothetical protein
MNLIIKYKLVIAIVLPILILVIIRELGTNHFKGDAKRWAEPSVMRSNTLSGEQIITLPGEKLLINLGEESTGINEMAKDALNIPADSILSKNYLNTIRKHDGPVVLFSSEPSVSARIWMVLSQMGNKNIYILTNDANNEVFKSKFRPDTIISPEL